MAGTLWTNGAAWIRGEVVPVAEATIGVTDWGLTHSDATYDVAPVWDGAFFRLEDYLDRFERSMAELRLTPAEGRDQIREALHAMVARSGLRRAYVSMVASRGQPLIPGSRDPRNCANHFFAWCVPYIHVIPEEVAARGARIWIAERVRRIPHDSVDPRVKNYHWGDFTRGLFEALDRGYDSALLLDHAGNLAEGPGFNIFAVIGDTVVTPAQGSLQGITRRSVLELAAAAGLTIQIRDVPKDEFLEADEIFTATTGGGPVPVVEVSGRVFANGAPGPVTEALRAGYWRMVARPEFRQPVAYDTA